MDARWRAWPVLLGALLVLGACDGGADPDDPSEPTTQTSPDGGTAEVDGAQVRVDIVDDGFEPTEVEVTAGDTVVWEHTGQRTHTVAFEDGESSAGLESGDAYERTFTTEGEFPYVCAIHPSMRGLVVVSR